MHNRNILVLVVVALIFVSGSYAVFYGMQSQSEDTTNKIDTPELNGNETEFINDTLKASSVVKRHSQGLQDAGSYKVLIAQRTEQVGQDTVPNRQDVYRAHSLNLESETETVTVEVLRGGTGINNTGAIPSSSKYYKANGTLYSSQTQFNTTQYDVAKSAPPVRINESSQTEALNTFLSSMEYERIAKGELNETTFYRYKMVEITDMEELSQTPDSKFTNVSSEIIIDDNGIVRSIQFRGIVQKGNRSIQTRLSTSYTDVGSTVVQKPEWVENAISEGNRTEDEPFSPLPDEK